MQDVQIGLRISSESDAALVGDHDHFAPGPVEPSDGVLDPGQQLELLPRGYVVSFGGLPVQHSVPIQENEANICKIDGLPAAHWDYNFRQ